MPKSFKDKMIEKATNPTKAFISTSEAAQEAAEWPQEAAQRKGEQEQAQQVQEPERSQKRPLPAPRTPIYDEPKSRRLQLLIRPSLHEDLKNLAQQQRISLNELINIILQEAVRK